MNAADWNDDEAQPVQLIAVCHTPGCPAEGVECPGWYYPVGNYDPPRYLGACGQCGKQVTDLRPVESPAPPPDQEPAPTEPVEPTPTPTEPAPTEPTAP